MAVTPSACLENHQLNELENVILCQIWFEGQHITIAWFLGTVSDRLRGDLPCDSAACRWVSLLVGRAACVLLLSLYASQASSCTCKSPIQPARHDLLHWAEFDWYCRGWLLLPSLQREIMRFVSLITIVSLQLRTTNLYAIDASKQLK